MAKPTALAHRVASDMRARRRRHGEAVAEAERALALDPNGADNQIAMALALTWAGRGAEAPPFVERAMRLDPHYPAYYLFVLGLARFAMGQSEKAVALLERTLSRNPDYREALLPLAAAQEHLGRDKEAENTLDRYLTPIGLRRSKGRYLSGWSVGWYLQRWPFRDAKIAERFGAGLVRAGMCCQQETVTEFVERMKAADKME